MSCKRSSLYGVGINDADYVISKFCKGKIIWVCPFYRVWTDMLKRCFSDKYKVRQPTYEQTTCADSWLLFSNFIIWMKTQDWEDKELDKDLLVKGNKHYSPETCVFVKRDVNLFIRENESKRGKYLIGCSWYIQTNKFVAQCRSPFTKNKQHLGYFNTELEAHLAWRKRKHELALQLADLQTDVRVAEALRTRYL